MARAEVFLDIFFGVFPDHVPPRILTRAPCPFRKNRWRETLPRRDSTTEIMSELTQESTRMFFHSPMVWRCSDQISQHSFCTDCLKSQRIGFYWFACTINEIGQTVQEEMHRKSRRTRDSARPIMIIFRLGEGIFCRRNKRDRADSGKRKLQKKNSHDYRT